MQVEACLGVDDDHLTAGFDVASHQLVGLDDHEVRLERHGDEVAGGSDDVGPEGQVGDEDAVHHVPLDAVDAGLLEGLALVAQPGEVGGEHGRGDVDLSVGTGRVEGHRPKLALTAPAARR